MKALVLGRFQPLHNGHIRMIRKASQLTDELVIGIGSSNKSRTYKNPFTFDERKFMLESSVHIGIPYKIIGIPDFGNSDMWISWIDDNIDFDTFISNAENELKIFKDYGFKTIALELRDDKISSTKVREYMIEKKPIDPVVPPVVMKFINEMDLKLIWI
jgi:nicotinamide-nucleotide adenylyltransferase